MYLQEELQKESSTESQWEQHVSLTLIPESDSPVPPVMDAGEFKQLLGRHEEGGASVRINSNPLVKEFGPCFNGPVKFGHSSSSAIGQISLPGPLQKHDANDAYFFHPALMDACFQTAAMALTRGDDLEKEQGLILMGIDRFEMFAAPSNALWCQVKLPLDDGRITEILSVDLMIYNPDGSPVASASGLNFRKVCLTDMVEALEADAGFYEVAWHPETPRRLRYQSAMPSPDDIKNSLNSSPAKDANNAQPVRFLENLSHYYVKEAFSQLGWAPVPNVSFTTRELSCQLNIAPRHHRLMERLLEILAMDGSICRQDTAWRITASGTMVKDEPVFSGHPEIQAELTLLKRFGSKLALVMKGECDPLTLLFPEADLSNAVRLYEQSLAFGAINRVVGKTARQIIKQISPGQELRILELGAGTGGTTAHMLPVLEGHPVRYTFTDVTRIFNRKAKDRFARYPFVEYRLLDIEKDPLSQGYETGSFDIVLAANVLHATADLAVTLKHIRKLMAPGGLLLLVEGTAVRGWIDLIFGVIEGWWKFQDHQLRPDYPLMPADQWKAVLKENDFHDPVSITPVPVKEALFPQSIILARRGDEQVPLDVQSVNRHWLVFGDRGQVADRITQGILQPGDAVTQVCHKDQPDQKDQSDHKDGKLVLNFEDPEQFKSLLCRMPEITHVIYLWGLDARTHEQMDAGELARHMRLTCGSLLYLVQALAAYFTPEFEGLKIITAGGQPVGSNSATHPAMAPLWGMADVIQHEHPEFNCRIIDIDPLSKDRDFACLSSLLTDSETSPKTVIRNGDIFIPRLEKRRVSLQTFPETETGGTVLITGGMGGIGLSMARHLVKKGFRHLVLLGRRLPEPKAQVIIDDLISQGAGITVMTADVADCKMLNIVFDRMKTDLPPLKGVIHTAGVIEDSLLNEHTWERFEHVFAAKVLGSWNLHTLTRECELEFFVLFSSAMTFLPNPGLSNYVAANSFMDLLAHYRQHLDLPAVSIAWGPWDDVGMASAVGVKRQSQWAAFGLKPLEEHNALDAFDRLIQPMDTQAMPNAGAMSLDWQTFARYFSSSVSQFHAGLIPAEEEDTVVSFQKTSAVILLDMLTQMVPEKRQDALIIWLQEIVAGVMGFDQVKQLDMEDGFFQQGMDSLTAVELRGRLQRELNGTIPATAIFKHPTVFQLGDYIAQNFLDHLIPQAKKSNGPLEQSDDTPLGKSQINEPVLDVPSFSETNLDDSVETELRELERMLDLSE